jgi:hypothetical protein
MTFYTIPNRQIPELNDYIERQHRKFKSEIQYTIFDAFDDVVFIGVVTGRSSLTRSPQSVVVNNLINIFWRN